ncbi:MAG: hypothetical protein IJP86_05340 [Synergistaceae bacterium]|nr:hypothetical protein [Synergistaceae bacterium]
MTQGKTERERLTEERDKCGQMMAVWAILKGGDVVGRITARYLRGGAVNVMFVMYGTTRRDREIRGFARRTCGYSDRVKEAIREILMKLTDDLHVYYGTEEVSLAFDWINHWEDYFEYSGYKVARVL